MLEETEFCFWLKGYLDSGAEGGLGPITERLDDVLEHRLVVHLCANGYVVDQKNKTKEEVKVNDDK